MAAKTLTRALITMLALVLLASAAFAESSTPNPANTQIQQINSIVPTDSWQYNAVLRLYNDSVTGGLTDKDLNGGVAFTRMQMARFIHNAQKEIVKTPARYSDDDVRLLNRLAGYYSSDLSILGLEYNVMQETSSSEVLLAVMNDKYWFPKFSFTAEVDMDTHMSQNPASNSKNASSINVNGYPGTFFPDVYLQAQINGRMSDNWFYYGELRFDPGGVDVSTDGLYVPPALRQLEAFGPLYGAAAYYNAGSTGAPQGGEPNQKYFGQPFGVTAYFGRMEDQVPFNDNIGNQGIVLDNHMTGVRFAMPGERWSGDIFGGYEDSQFSNYSGYGNFGVKYDDGKSAYITFDNPLNAFVTGADIGYHLSDNTQLYGGYYQFWGYDNGSKAWAPKAPLQFLELGMEQALGSAAQLTVYACGSPNYNINTTSLYTPASQSAIAMYTTNWTDNAGILARLSYGNFDQLQPGSVSFYGQGSCIGAGAIWGSSTTNAANYDNEVYQPNRALGAAGYELGMNYAPIRNSSLLISFSETWPKNTPVAGSQWLPNTDGVSTVYNNNSTAPYNILKCEIDFYF